jgi:hypothetical protein
MGPPSGSSHVFTYTSAELDAIFEKLGVPDEQRHSAMLWIYGAVIITRPIQGEPSTQSEESDRLRRRREVGYAIDQLLCAMDELGEDLPFYPEIEDQLKLVRKHFFSTMKQHRGGVSVVRNQSMMELVGILADLWAKYRGERPTYSFDPYKEKSVGPFRSFVSLCTSPAGFEVPDSVLKRGLSQWRRARSSAS